jgi:hypothetical protein
MHTANAAGARRSEDAASSLCHSSPVDHLVVALFLRHSNPRLTCDNIGRLPLNQQHARACLSCLLLQHILLHKQPPPLVVRCCMRC